MTRAVADADDPAVALAKASPSITKQADESTDEITRLRSEIALRRQRLDTALHRLEHRVSEDLDWRRRVVAHPWLVLGAAALAGFAIGRLTGGRPSPSQRGEVE